MRFGMAAPFLSRSFPRKREFSSAQVICWPFLRRLGGDSVDSSQPTSAQAGLCGQRHLR
jgi:hypothetical protein